MRKTSNPANQVCAECSGSRGRHGKSTDGVNLGPWIPCKSCTKR